MSRHERADLPGAITDLDAGALTALVVERGGKPFQARQVEHWLYKHGAVDVEGCRNLPQALRAALRGGPPLIGSQIAHVSLAADGTAKLLLKLTDGEQVETVVIPDEHRTTLCVSTQVGCPVGCVFCASGLDGVRRNLTAGEIVEQYLHARHWLRGQAGSGPAGTRAITNVVVMGMGEPLLNLDALLPALDRLRDPAGVGLGARRITVSTSGYPERMRRFATAPAAYGLAVSLHAAEDELRRRLVPTARASVAEIVAAAGEVFERSGREVTFEVVLLAGVNDRPQDAAALLDRLRGLQCTVNLIPWNPVDAISGFTRPDDAAVARFAAALRAGGCNVTIRRQRGADRTAACGQLRLQRSGAPAG